MLAPSARKAILARVLRNLKAIYSKYADALRAVAILELLVRLEPDNLPDLRERGLAYASLGSYSLAARDLEAYLAAATAAPDASGVSALVADLRERAARVN
jgi:regulator of sirC expression with transglutaminase-like and TPR domain